MDNCHGHAQCGGELGLRRRSTRPYAARVPKGQPTAPAIASTVRRRFLRDVFVCEGAPPFRWCESCGPGTAGGSPLFASADFVHHNPWFAADAWSLATALDDNARANPEKSLEVLRAIAEGDLVVAHSRVRHAPDGLTQPWVRSRWRRRTTSAVSSSGPCPGSEAGPAKVPNCRSPASPSPGTM